MKKEELQIGMRVIFNVDVNIFGYKNNDFNDSELEITDLKDRFGNDSIDVGAKIIVATSKAFLVGTIVNVNINCLILKSSLKPHEYSPVYMTGRYKTVGD